MALNRVYRIVVFLLISVAAMALTSCNDDSNSVGTLTLSITDAPVDGADNVFVQISAIEIHASANNNITETFDPPKQIDLLALQGPVSETLIEGLTLEATSYQWIRLTVDTENDLDTYIVINGANHELSIPSADQNGLKLVSGFNIPEDGEANFTIDFDLRKSVHTTGNGNNISYRLKPALRLIDNTRRGNVAGTVASTLLAGPACTSGNYVYIYEGDNIVPVDINNSDNGPLTTVPVVFNNDLSVYSYESDFLAPGDYTVALTCQGDDDDPESQDGIEFINPANITITANSTSSHDF